MIFLERELKEQEDGVVVGVGCPLAERLLPLISTEKVHAVAKSTLSKVQIPRCRKGQSPITLSEVDVVQSPTLSKKKSKFCGNLTRSGVRVRGLGLVWTSALTRSDRNQHQTRPRTRHRNLNRLVSLVLLTSPLSTAVADHVDKTRDRRVIERIRMCELMCGRSRQPSIFLWSHTQTLWITIPTIQWQFLATSTPPTDPVPPFRNAALSCHLCLAACCYSTVGERPRSRPGRVTGLYSGRDQGWVA